MKNFRNKRIYLVFLTVFIILSQGFAQKKFPDKASDKLLPLDTAIRTGKLANGFTYFISHNSEPKSRVLFYLANKVGSILEDEDQQGLAHFMEHMNFNGTKNFPKNELVNYLQKAGVRFGADINAYTGFDETVFQLPLPSDKKEIVENGIEIMHDWAQGALLDTNEINSERGVILEEKRLGKGANERMQRMYLPLMLNHSRYGQRLPIGIDTVINNFKPLALQNYYHDWYRPDLQALIVVGDINVDDIEKIIKSKFSDLKNPVNEKTRIKYSIPLTGKNQFIAVTDKEMSSTIIEVSTKQKGFIIHTATDYRRFIIQQLFNRMLGERFKKLSTQANPPFIYASGSIGELPGGLFTYTITASAKPHEVEKGFKAAWIESERLKRYGFAQSELDRIKKVYLNNIESSLENKDKTSSAIYINDYLKYFLHDEASPGITSEYELTKTSLKIITLKDLNSLAKELMKPIDRDVIIMAPEKDKAQLPDSATVQNWMQQVQREKLKVYNDDYIDKPLLSGQPISGKILKEEMLDSIQATKLTLSNGATIILKHTDFRNNEISFQAFSPGGTSLYSDADYQSAVYAAYLTTMAGLGPFNFNQFTKYLSSKTLGLAPSIGENAESISGFTTRKELETFLQVIYLYFTKPKKDTTAFNNLITISKAELANRNSKPNSVFEDSVALVMGNYNIRRTGPSVEKLEQIDLNKSYKIFRERFNDASDFTFTFVGNYDTAKLKSWIKKYIASLPSTQHHEVPKNLGIHPIAGKLTKIVYKGIEPKATVRLVFSGDYNYDPVTNKLMDAIAEILQIRLLERLREEESGVYSPQVFVNYRKIPEQRYVLTISFGCSPEHVEKLINSTLDKVSKLKIDGGSELNIEKFKAENRRNHELQLRNDGFWSNYLTEQILNNEDINEVNLYDSILEKINRVTIKDTTNKYLSGNNLIKFLLLPEKSKQ